MNVTVYRIQHKITKLFWNGKYWTKIGKTYSQIGHVKCAYNWLCGEYSYPRGKYRNHYKEEAVIVWAQEVDNWQEIDLINT